MEKFIIDNKCNCHPVKALNMIAKVVEMGKISNDGACYCYTTAFKDAHVVFCYQNKKSYRFEVTRHERGKQNG